MTPGSFSAAITFAKGAHSSPNHFDAARKHFDDADLSFAVISRAPIERVEQVKRALGWTFLWGSSYGSYFNYDFGVSFRGEELVAGTARLNYDTIPLKKCEDKMGASIFAQNETGENLPHLLGLFPWH